MSKTYPHTNSIAAIHHSKPAGKTLRRPDPRQHADPLDYDHPWPSMAEHARRLALISDASCTRHSYYRAIRLVHGHFGCDPMAISDGAAARLHPPRQDRQGLEAKNHPPDPRLSRYRIPVKLIYCCGLRLSECLAGRAQTQNE